MAMYALDDKYLSNGASGKSQPFTGPNNPFSGWVWAVPGMTQYQEFNPTCKLGTTSIIMLSVGAQMGKDNYKVTKVDESIEVSPHHAQYYQLTIKQREEIEAKIREGLIRISQSIADMELLEHDIRKYEKYMSFIKMSESEDSEKRKRGEMLLKTIFVDQVDYHAGKQGQGPGRFSMALMRNANIFPTIVDDFMDMQSVEDLSKSKRFIHLPLVEKHFLEVKWSYYQKWKEMFKEQVKKRLERLREMYISRQKSLEEFKKWVYPYLFRLKAINVATESKDSISGNKFLWVRTSGDALAMTMDKFWAWRGLTLTETFRPTEELLQFARSEEKYRGELGPYNDFTKKVLIFGREYGLINKFPWITKQWVDEKAGSLVGKVSAYDFWTFIIYQVDKAILKYPPNVEIEDATWTTSAATLSSNALLVKLLELEAMKEELLFYVDKMLGVIPGILKEQGEVVGYVEEGGRYYPVKDGRYVEVNGRRISFSSLYDLEENIGKVEIEEGGSKTKPFGGIGKAKLVEAEIVYYTKKGKKYKINGTEYGSLDEYISKRKAEARGLEESGKFHEAAFMRAFLLKPKPPLDLSFLKSLLGWKYSRYRKGGVTPYERDFMDRITQFYLVPTAVRYGGFMGMLYSKYGIPPEGTP